MRGRDERVSQLQAHALRSVDAQARDVQRALHRALRAPEMARHALRQPPAALRGTCNIWIDTPEDCCVQQLLRETLCA